MGSSRRRVHSYAVDGFGLVDCPQRDQPPTVTECVTCPYLVGAITDEDDEITRVRCTAPPQRADRRSERTST